MLETVIGVLYRMRCHILEHYRSASGQNRCDWVHNIPPSVNYDTCPLEPCREIAHGYDCGYQSKTSRTESTSTCLARPFGSCSVIGNKNGSKRSARDRRRTVKP